MNFSDVLDEQTNEALNRFWQSQTDATVEGLSTQEEFALLQNITEQLQSNLDAMKQAGSDTAQGFADGMAENTAPQDTAEQMADKVETAAKQRLKVQSPSRVFKDIGANVAIGLGEGIYSQAAYAISAARWLASEIEAATRTALDIHSPSGVAEELGEYYGLGFISGIENSMGGIDAAFTRMANESLVMQAPPAAGSAPQTAGGGVDSARLLLDALSNAVVQIDGENAGRLMLPTIEALMAEQVASRRFA